MAKEITKSIEQGDWYRSIVDDCQAILTERVWNSRSELIIGYGEVGQRIFTDKNYQKYGKGNRTFNNKLFENIGIGERSGYYCLEFYEKFIHEKFDDVCTAVQSLPFREGKNISWNKIKTLYLPNSKKEIPLPKGKYQVLLCDPPWPYPKRQDAKNLYGNTNYHYEVMPIKELCEMKVANLADENSVLFIWVATNFLDQSFEVIKSWGFDYKSQMVWVKEGGQGGIGWYFWGDHELLLVATRGSMLPQEKFSSVLKAPRREHSKKPEEVYKIIEAMYPKTKRVELFARGKTRKGWSAWGDQVDEE